MFRYEVKGQAVYNGVKRRRVCSSWHNRSFLIANAYTLGYGRNINDRMSSCAQRYRRAAKMVEKRLFSHESPIGKTVRVSGHTYTIVGILAEKGTHLARPGQLCA